MLSCLSLRYNAHEGEREREREREREGERERDREKASRKRRILIGHEGARGTVEALSRIYAMRTAR